MVACVDCTRQSYAIADAAAGLALALDLPLVLFHVIEPSDDLRRRPDPLEWQLLRRQACDHLDVLRAALPLAPEAMTVALAEGERTNSICQRAAEPGSILVMGSGGDGNSPFFRGLVSRQVIERALGPVLLVPINNGWCTTRLERILVPLDGSHHADNALAQAARIARNSGAELLLAHVVPEPELAHSGLPERADIELVARLDQRNRLAASDLLERATRRLTDQGLKVRSICLDGEPRAALLRTISDANPSLVVLSARGQGGRHCLDLPIGSTANYLLDHLVTPTLFVPAGPIPAGTSSPQPQSHLSASIQAA
ncbi:MAG TPA: universal stress protein [Sphingomonadaceae bacterium]|nr:universal stress protein [Sphingomonadaceae bacterium]